MLGLWLFIVLIPSVISAFHGIVKEMRISTAKHKLYKLKQYTKSEQYEELSPKEKDNILSSITVLESVLEDILGSQLTKEDIEISLQIRDIIDDIITTEINHHIHDNYIAVTEKYDIRKLDIDVKKISQKVFNAINIDTFDLKMIFSKEYLVGYIVDTTKSNLLLVVTQYNENLNI